MNCACGCGGQVTGKKGAKYAHPKCRAIAFRSRKAGIPSLVRSVRRLKSGNVSLIVHVPALWAQEAFQRQKGDNVGIVTL